MYTKDYHIERYHVNQHNELHIGELMHYLNDIMERNAESYGAGARYHLSQDLAWVLTQYEVIIHRQPKADEIVSVGTIPYSFKRMVGFRKYEIKDKAGNLLIEGKGKFLLINIKTKEMVRPSHALLDLFTDAIKEPVALPFAKWKVVKDTKIHSIKTFVSHGMIDANKHMNNAYFVALAYEALPKTIVDENKIIGFDIVFRKEAFFDDVLTIDTFQDNTTLYTVLTRNDEVLGEVRFELEKR